LDVRLRGAQPAKAVASIKAKGHRDD
jgi:hypothetical protein